jgi:hypothetical protein
MEKMKARTGVFGVTTIVASLVVASYMSPQWTMRQMKVAMQDGDANSFSEHVDFPALRESFKGQLTAIMDRKLGAPDAHSNPFSKLGQVMAAALITPMVDAMVSPAGVIRMMQSGRVKPSVPGNDTHSAPAPNDVATYSFTYRSWSKVAVRSSKDDAGSFILTRDGVWSWKLSAVELPETLLNGPTS